MPIITVQRRMTPQGNIRIGQKVTGTRKDGSTYTRPGKLERFRFTSPSQRLIEEIAAAYGGEARPWDNDGKAEWEVLSNATTIPVLVVKGGFSQWHEHFTKAGLQHRCDGEKDPAGAFCDPQDPAHLAAIEKPTTRLSVMLEEIESLGVWTLVTKSWNAAAELPSMTELAMYVSDMVPATLGLREKSSVIQTDKGPQTSRYMVPYLDLHVTKKRLVEIVGAQTGALAAIEGGGQDRPALAAGSGDVAADPYTPFFDQVDKASSYEDLTAIWDLARGRGLVGSTVPLEGRHAEFVEAWKARARSVKPLEQSQSPEPDAEGVVDAELVDDGDPEAIWQQILAKAGGQQWTEGDLREDFQQQMGGLDLNTASAAELRHYLGLLEQGAAA